jgi:hypothetical protein
MGGLLLLGAVIVFASNDTQVREINLFGYVLIVQSLPFLSATSLGLLEGSRINDFAFWRRLQTRLAALLPKQPAVKEVPVATENRAEAAQ